MNSIELTEQHREKLLEMCKALFPEYPEVIMTTDYFMVETGEIEFRNWKDIDHRKWITTKPIHWFEFCYKHLAKKVLKSNYYKLTAFTNLTIIGNIHPIDYLYQHYKSQQ